MYQPIISFVGFISDSLGGGTCSLDHVVVVLCYEVGDRFAAAAPARTLDRYVQQPREHGRREVHHVFYFSRSFVLCASVVLCWGRGARNPLGVPPPPSPPGSRVGIGIFRKERKSQLRDSFPRAQLAPWRVRIKALELKTRNVDSINGQLHALCSRQLSSIVGVCTS